MNLETYRGLVDHNNKTMKSTDLHRFVYEATGKFKELKTFHRKIKLVLFGTETPTNAEISEGTDFAPTLRANNQIAYLNLSEVECNMIMAAIDVRHLRLIAKVFVAVKNSERVAPPQTYIEALKALVVSEEAKQKALEEKQKALEQVEQRDKTIAIVYHSQNSYTHTEVAQSLPVPISGKLFCKILNEAGIVYKTGNAWGLYSHYHGYKLSTIAEYTGNDGNTHVSFRWTAKGKNWITKHWEEAIDRCSLETRQEWEEKASRHEPKIPRKRKPKSPNGGED